MVTANELLNSLTNSEAEGHVVIGVNRKVVVPEALKRIAVQYDHNVETVTFDCPRYWDNLDMSKMAVYINYMRSDGYTDSYPVGTVTVDEDDSNIMHFNWTISRNVTEVAGVISFLVCIKNTDSEGNEVNHWNSELCQDLYVSPGMETDEQYEEVPTDLVTQLLLRMSTVEEINIQASEMESLLAQTKTAKEETEAARDIAVDESDYIKNSYANAIKGGAKGEIIRVDDVSPIEHDVKCKVHGKNLVNPVDFTIGKSISGGGAGEIITILDNAIMAVIKRIDVEPNTTYTFSLDNSIYWLDRICEMDENDLCTFNHGFYSSEINNHSTYSWTTQSDTKYIVVRVRNTTGETPTLESIQTASIQIEKGVATAYEPYIDPTTVTVTRCGKNLFDISKAVNGDVLVSNKNGTYTLTKNGGNRLSNVVAFHIPANTSFVWSFDIVESTTVITLQQRLPVCIFYADGTERTTALEKGRNNMFEQDIIGIQLFQRAEESDGTYTTFKNFQVELGSEATDYEPYTGATYTPASDGTVDVTSLSPTMTIFTDTPGVTVEAEYNRDTTKAMTSYIFTEEIKDEIAAKVEDDMAEVLASLNSYAESLIGGDS